MKVNFSKNTKPAAQPAAPRPEVTLTVLAEGRNGLKAFANVMHNGMFFNGLRVFEGQDGELYLQYPARDTGTTNEDGSKRWANYFNPTKELKEELTKKVVGAYKAALGEENDYVPSEVELPADAVRVRLIPENTWGGLANVSVTFRGMYLNNMVVMVSKEGNPYVQFPSRVRMKDGEPVIGENGYQVRDAYYGATTAEVRNELVSFVLKRTQEEYEKANA